MSVERRFWTVDDIALLCAVVRNTKLSPDMIGLAIMLIFFILSVGFGAWTGGLMPGQKCDKIKGREAYTLVAPENSTP